MPVFTMLAVSMKRPFVKECDALAFVDLGTPIYSNDWTAFFGVI